MAQITLQMKPITLSLATLMSNHRSGVTTWSNLRSVITLHLSRQGLLRKTPRAYRNTPRAPKKCLFSNTRAAVVKAITLGAPGPYQTARTREKQPPAISNFPRSAQPFEKPIGISYVWLLRPSSLTRARARTQTHTKTPASERNSRQRFPVFLGARSSLKPIGISYVCALRPSAPTSPRPP